MSNDNCYWFPQFFNANTPMFRMTHIFPIVINACKNAGFKVRGKYIKARSKVRFSCCHGFIHHEQMNKKYVEAKYVKMNKVLQKSTKKKTQLPIPSSTPMDPSKLNTNCELSSITCKCSFSLFWDEAKQRWYFPHLQSGCLKHTGHLQLQSNVIRLPLRHCIVLIKSLLFCGCFFRLLLLGRTHGHMNLRFRGYIPVLDVTA